mmetsp:Transcript_118226/g.381601  ORF Transcript_118226/g.381601 Transcript_118226/m.381601 type:complete len:281 (-) Transcript_118226:12-854(-)
MHERHRLLRGSCQQLPDSRDLLVGQRRQRCVHRHCLALEDHLGPLRLHARQAHLPLAVDAYVAELEVRLELRPLQAPEVLREAAQRQRASVLLQVQGDGLHLRRVEGRHVRRRSRLRRGVLYRAERGRARGSDLRRGGGHQGGSLRSLRLRCLQWQRGHEVAQLQESHLPLVTDPSQGKAALELRLLHAQEVVTNLAEINNAAIRAHKLPDRLQSLLREGWRRQRWRCWLRRADREARAQGRAGEPAAPAASGRLARQPKHPLAWASAAGSGKCWWRCVA